MLHPAITLKHLETLVRVAELGSFRRAADLLGTTQPNVSIRIAALEDALGTQVLMRGSGPVRLTERGAAIRDQAQRVLAEAEALADVAHRTDLVTGRLRLGVAELIACTWLHRFLRRFSEAFPKVTVELTVDLSRTLEDELARGTLDLIFQNRPFQTQVGGAVELGGAPYVWVSATPHAGLGDQTILTQPRGTPAFAELEAYLTAAGHGTARLAPSSSVASCAQMARDGLGLAMLPRALVADDLKQGRLTELNFGWLPKPLSFAARYDTRSAAPHVQRAAELARDESDLSFS